MLVSEIKYSLSVTLLLLTQTFLFAQKSDLKFDHFNSLDGLSESAVFAITQDQRGFMWFGTRSGLNRFDGYSFTSYKHDEDDPFSISGNEIISLIECQDKNLWIGTRDEGLNRFVYTSQRFYRYNTKLINGEYVPISTVNFLLQTSEGKLLVATKEGLVFHDSIQDILVSTTNDVLKDANVKTLSLSSIDGCIWVGTKIGAYLFDINEQKIIKSFVHNPTDPKSLSDNYVTSILEDTSGKIWITTFNQGLNKLDSLNSTAFRHYRNIKGDKNSMTSDVLRLIRQDRSGTIWIGTQVTLEELSVEQQIKNSPVFIHHQHNESNQQSLSHNSIYSFYEDKNGDFWIGTYNGGVNLLYAGMKRFKQYKHDFMDPLSINNDIVNSFEERDEGIWIGTNIGLNLWDRDLDVFYDFSSNLESLSGFGSHRIKAFKTDEDGLLWIGSSHGLFTYDVVDSKFTLVLSDVEVITIEDGISDEIWIGTPSGLLVYNKQLQTVNKYRSNDNDSSSISSNSIKKIFKQSEGTIWVATKKGLNYYNRESDNFVRCFNRKKDKSSISDNYVTSICEDNNGDIWIGTFNGINTFDSVSKSFTQYKDVLLDDIILNLVYDNEGFLWATTTKQLIKCKRQLDTNELSVFGDYDRRDGLQDEEFKLGACYKTNSGELLFGGRAGFNLLNPKMLKDNSRIPDVVLTDLKLFNKSVTLEEDDSPLKNHISATQSIQLTHRQSIVTFCFASLNYIASSKNQYAYKLEGFEETWNYVGAKREATYTNLSPGSYTFKVIASNNDGLWNPEGALLLVEVLPAWWETWWFRLFITWVLILVLWGMIRSRFNSLSRKKRFLENKITERTQELEEAFNKLKGTQSQLVQSEKMASIGLLTSGVAHEINNPLNFIQGSKNFFNQYVDENLVDHKHELDPFLEAMQMGLDRTSDIVSSLNRFNRRNVNYKEQCNLHEIIDDCLIILQGQLRDRITVSRHYSEDYSTIEGNQGELHQLILNVLSNAEQSIASKGDVTIRTSLEKSKFVIRISDSGEGISRDNIEKVTDPFFTTKDPGKGVGLGMSISFSIIKKHKGNLGFESEIGKGTTVIIIFPVDSKFD